MWFNSVEMGEGVGVRWMSPGPGPRQKASKARGRAKCRDGAAGAMSVATGRTQRREGGKARQGNVWYNVLIYIYIRTHTGTHSTSTHTR